MREILYLVVFPPPLFLFLVFGTEGQDFKKFYDLLCCLDELYAIFQFYFHPSTLLPPPSTPPLKPTTKKKKKKHPVLVRRGPSPHKMVK